MQCKKCRKDETILSIISAREAHTAGVIMDRLSGDVQAQTTKHGAKDQAEEIDDRQKHLARGGQVLAPVEVEPENTAEPVREPGSEEGSDQAQQVAEDWNGFGDDPGDGPEGERDGDPGAHGHPVPFVDPLFFVGEDAEVDVFNSNVAVNDAGDDDSRQGDAVGNLGD